MQCHVFDKGRLTIAKKCTRYCYLLFVIGCSKTAVADGLFSMTSNIKNDNSQLLMFDF